ncbi:hypothetical protein KLP28_05560 [Nocardioidaceae bacterium]|nr:hypothetical protein KLP28_05560 [Nocardioidaceae bacterium]
MSWQIGMAANSVIAVAYFAITVAIVRPLIRSGQLRSNPLGAATAAIFLTCAVHHGSHAVHMLMPAFGVDEATGGAMRAAWTPALAVWDLVSAFVAVYYLTLRRTYSSLMAGAQLFEDYRSRERQALELNDNILQALVVVRMAVEVGDEKRALASLDTAIGSASGMITGLLESGADTRGLLRRTSAILDAQSSRAAAGRSTGDSVHDTDGTTA